MKEDLIPEYKPSIKNTLREFWELREENYEEENKSQKMREEKSKERSQSISMQMDDRYEFDDTIKSTPNQKLSRKNSKLIKVSGEKERYRKNSEHSESGKKSNHSHSGHKGERRPPRVIQKTQPTEYMVKLAKALEESKVMKGKLKISQKLSFPTSSTLSALMGKKTVQFLFEWFCNVGIESK